MFKEMKDWENCRKLELFKHKFLELKDVPKIKNSVDQFDE